MIRNYALALMGLSFACHATDVPGSECAAPGHYNEEMLFSAAVRDLGITSVARDKTTVQIISIAPVSEVFARQLAKIDSKKDNDLSENEYFNIYHTGHVINLTAEYVYINAEGKHDIFIASSLMNDDECSVRFNGFLTVSREF